MKSPNNDQLLEMFDTQMNQIDSEIYHVLLDFLVDNEYYVLADRLFDNCEIQKVEIQSKFESESMLDCFMTYFEAKEYTKINYYLDNGFDISVHQPWLLKFLTDEEYRDVLDYITLYERTTYIIRIKSRIRN
jgi:hypothetical protein